MSTSVDNRVVSMEFDNAKFERNVETSLNTLKHLDQSLDSLTHGSKAFDGVSFENLANQIDNIASRFTLMGRITMRVFDEIADGIVNLGKKIISFNTDQLESGWGKYADKTTSVQTIMSATGMTIDDVSTQLERLNRFTDETSYSFTDMTSNIAKFTSQGIDLDTAVTQMQGIATWAASAGQNAQSASRAMYNISQAMGAGSMKLIDWKSIQNANMATKEFKEQAIAAGVAMGTLSQQGEKVVVTGSDLEVSAKNFEQTLQKGWFNTEAMQKVFSDYGKFAVVIDEVYEKYDENIMVSKLLSLANEQATKTSEEFEESLAAAAEEAGLTDEQIAELRKDITALNAEELQFSKATYKAAQEAKTFGDAIDAAKDAMSTSWMNLFETIFGNYEQAKVLWTDLAEWFYDIFATPINNLNGVFNKVLNTEFWNEGLGSDVKANVKETALALLDFGDAAEKAFKDLGIVSEKDIETFGSVKEAIKNIDLSADKVGSVIDNLLGGQTGATKGISTLEDARAIVQDIWHGMYGSGQARRDALTEAGYDPDKMQTVLNKLHYGIQVTEEDLTGLQTNMGITSEEQIKQLTELKKRLDNGTASLKEYQAVSSKMTGRQLLFDREVGAFYNLMETVKSIQSTIGGAWNDVFGEGRVQRIYNLISAFQAFTLKIRNLTSENETFSNAMKALFTIFKIGAQAVSSVFTAISKIFSLFKVGSGGLFNLINKISELVFQFDNWLTENEIFSKGIETVVGWVKTFKDALTPTVDKIKEFVGRVNESSRIKQAFSWLSTGFAEGLNLVNKGLAKLAGGIGTLVDAAIKFYDTHIDSIFTSIRTAIGGWNLDRVVTMFANAKDAVVDFFKILWNFIRTGDWNTFVQEISARFETLVEWVARTKDIFTNWFSSIDKNTLQAIAGLAGGLLSFIGVMKLIKSFSSVKYAFIEFLSDISSAVKTYARSKFVGDILKIASSIAILAGALFIISKVPKDRLWSSVAILGGMVAALSALTIIMSKLAGSKGAMNIAPIITSVSLFAISLGILVAALIALTRIDLNNIVEALKVLGIIMIMLGIMVAGLSKANASFAGAGFGMIAYAAGILLMVRALKIIQKDTSVINVDAFKKLSALIVILIGMGLAMRKVRFGSALGIIALAASLVFVQKKIKQAMEEAIPLTDFQKYWKELVSIIGILFGLSLVLRMSGKGSLRAVLSILALIGLIFVVSNAIERLGKIDDKRLLKGVGAVTAIGLVFAALLWALGQTKGINKSSAKAVTSVVIGIIALLLALVVISAIPLEALAKGLIVVVAVLGVFALVLKEASNLVLMSKNNGKGIATMIIVVLALAGLLTALWQLAELDKGDELVKAAESISMILIALSVAMRLLSKVNVDGFDSNKAVQMIVLALTALIPALAALYALQAFNIQASIPTVTALSMLIIALAAAARIINSSGADWKQSLANSATLAVAAVAMLGAVLAMRMLNSVNVDGLLPKVAGLALLLEAMAAAVYIMSKSGDMNVEKVVLFGAAMAGMVVIFIILAEVMPYLENIKNVDDLITKVAGISMLLMAISACVLILSYMPTGSVATAAGGVLVALEMMIGVAAVFIGAGALFQQIPETASWLTTGAEVLGEAFGKFVGAFLGGILSGAITAAADLDSFAAALEPFMDQVSRFDESSIAGVRALAGMLLALAAADLVSSIDSFINFGAKLLGLNTTVSDKLVEFAGAIKSYVDALTELDPGQVNKVARITEAISTLIQSMPEEGGIFGWFKGKQSSGMSNMSEGMSGFGTAIKDFVDSIKDIPADAVVKTETAVKVAEQINAFSETLQKTGGLIQDIVGIQDIGAFGEQLTKFASAMFGGQGQTGFFQTLEEAEIDQGKIDKIEDLKRATGPLTEIAQSIPTIGGWIEKAIGSNDPSVFAEKMTAFVGSMKDILDEVATLDDSGTAVADLQNAKEIALALSEFNAAMNGENVDLSQQVDADGNVISQTTDVISDAMAKFMSLETDGAQDKMASLKDIFSGTSLFGEAGEGGIANLDALTEQFATVQEAITSGMTGITTVVDENAATTSESMTVFLEELNTSLQTFGEEATQNGEQFTVNYSTGIENKKSEVEQKASALVRAANSRLAGASGSAAAYGAQYGQGFANGIASKVGAVQSAVYQLAEAANHTLVVTLQIYSPSRLAKSYGEFYGEGFAIGIDSTASAVEKASQNIANASTSGLATALSAINDIVESDAQPVITPVLDLSEVRRGVNSISDINGITANVGYANASAVMSETSQNVSGSASQIQNGSTPTIQFNQYNNSPKALSRIEIYRQTKNLISMQREAASV